MRTIEAVRKERSTTTPDTRGEGVLMRLLVKLQRGACLPCFIRMSGLPRQHLDATLETLRTQVMIYADEERCPECRRPGHVVRLFDVSAPAALVASR